MAAIEFSGIAHSYSPQTERESDWALKPLAHRWEDGGAYALLGPSGCGKSTLLNIISGLLAPARGVLTFNGRQVNHLPPQKRDIAQVFQFPVVYDTMRVRDNLAFPLKNRGVSPRQINARVAQVADLLEITPLLNAPAATLSAEAKQIVSLGRGLVREDINAILFDEPLTVADPHIKWQLRSALKRLHARTGFTMIYVTHDQTEALTFADHIAVMHNGAIVQSGTAADLFECPRHTFVGHFIGSPGMNILPCQPDSSSGGSGSAVFIGAQRVRVSPYAGLGAGKTEIGIRPEFIRFADNGNNTPAPAAGDNVPLPVTVDKVQRLGRHYLITLRLAATGNPANNNPGIIKMLSESGSIPSSPAIVFQTNRAYLYEDGHSRAQT